MLAAASEALIGIRRAKTEAKASQKTPVARAVIAAPAATIELLALPPTTSAPSDASRPSSSARPTRSVGDIVFTPAADTEEARA